MTLAPPKTVTLQFTDNSTTESGFNVYRSTDGGTTFTLLTTIPAHAGTGTVTYNDNATQFNTTYTYQVSAFVKNVGSTPPTAESAVTNQASALTLPAPASKLTVSAPAAPQGSTELDLSWTDNNPAGTASSLSIFRSTGNTSNFVQVGTVATNTFADTGLLPNTLYLYKVLSTNTATPPVVGGGDALAYSDAPWKAHPARRGDHYHRQPGAQQDGPEARLDGPNPTPAQAQIQRSTDGGMTFTTVATRLSNVGTFTERAWPGT